MPKPVSAAAAAAPTPQSPVDGAVVTLDAATFRWAAPPGPAAFDVRIAAASAPGAPIVELDGLPSTEATLAEALPPGDLLWWVRRSGGAWSAPSAFRAGTPADVEVAQQLQAEADDHRGATDREARRRGTKAIPEAPPDPVWPFAEGEALDGASDVDWSAVPGFGPPARTDLPDADAGPPRPLAPLGGEVVDAVTVALRWTGVPGADGYEVELSPHAAFDRDVLALDAGRATEVALPGLVPAAGRRLLWRVRARIGDRATPWSKYGRFYPAAEAAVDEFRLGMDAALLAQRRQRDHAEAVRQRELELVPLHEREDSVTTNATLGAVIGMALTGLVVAIIAFVLSMTLGH